MEKPKCAVNNCNNESNILYVGNLICGECFMKLYKKEKENKLKELEELNDCN